MDQKPSARNRQASQPRSLMDDKARRRWEQDTYWRQQEAAWRNEEVRRFVLEYTNCCLMTNNEVPVA